MAKIVKKYGKNLRNVRKSVNQTQATFAKDLEISTPYMSQLETGKYPINDKMAAKIILVLKKVYKINYDRKLLGLTR